MNKRIIFFIFIFVFIIGLNGCKGNKPVPDIQGGSENNKTEESLDVKSYIPEINKVYIYKSSIGEGKINVTYELVKEGKYKRVETSGNEYEVNEIFKVENDAVIFTDYNAVNYGSERVSESIDKGTRVILKNVEPGDEWQNKYTVKRVINDINYYNGDEKCTFSGYEKITVMGKDMDSAVMISSVTLTDQGNSIVERVNMKLWMVKDIGPARYEIERVNGENRFTASFELVSTGEKK